LHVLRSTARIVVFGEVPVGKTFLAVFFGGSL